MFTTCYLSQSPFLTHTLSPPLPYFFAGTLDRSRGELEGGSASVDSPPLGEIWSEGMVVRDMPGDQRSAEIVGRPNEQLRSWLTSRYPMTIPFYGAYLPTRVWERQAMEISGPAVTRTCLSNCFLRESFSFSKASMSSCSTSMALLNFLHGQKWGLGWHWSGTE